MSDVALSDRLLSQINICILFCKKKTHCTPSCCQKYRGRRRCLFLLCSSVGNHILSIKISQKKKNVSTLALASGTIWCLLLLGEILICSIQMCDFFYHVSDFCLESPSININIVWPGTDIYIFFVYKYILILAKNYIKNNPFIIL